MLLVILVLVILVLKRFAAQIGLGGTPATFLKALNVYFELNPESKAMPSKEQFAASAINIFCCTASLPTNH
jgi:hypothetical protein